MRPATASEMATEMAGEITDEIADELGVARADIAICMYQPKDARAIATVYHSAVAALSVTEKVACNTPALESSAHESSARVSSARESSAGESSARESSATGSRPLYTAAQCRAWSSGIRDPRYWRSRLGRSLVLVARQGGELIGFIECELGFKDRGYIGYCYVSPAWQRQGVAGKLLNALIKLAPSYGVVTLSTDASKASRALFAAHGFCELGRSFQQKSAEVLPGFSMQLPLPFYVTPAFATTDSVTSALDQACLRQVFISHAELEAIARVFHCAVAGAAEHYTQAQRQAWSPTVRSAAEWRSRLERTWVWLAKAADGQLVGFINLKRLDDKACEVDCLFTAPEMQRRGVGASLLTALERHARDLRFERIRVHASHYAKPLFIKQGFIELTQNQHPRNGEVLVNFTLEKALCKPPRRRARL